MQLSVFTIQKIQIRSVQASLLVTLMVLWLKVVKMELRISTSLTYPTGNFKSPKLSLEIKSYSIIHSFPLLSIQELHLLA